VSCGCSVNGVCLSTGLAASGSIARGVSGTCNLIAFASNDVYFTTHRCQCNTGFAGDGFSCVADSDQDGYADFTITSCAGSCGYCRQDACPTNAAIAFAGWASLYTAATSSAAVQYNYIHNPFTQVPIPNAVWSFPTRVVNGVSVVDVAQTGRTNPSALIGSASLTGGYELTTLVTGLQPSTNADRGFFGLCFGFKNSANFYVAHWKFAHPTFDFTRDALGNFGSSLGNSGVDPLNDPIYYSTAGLTIKRYFAQPTAYSLWATNVTGRNYDFTNQFASLYQDFNRNTWSINVQYRFQVSYRPSIGYIRVRAFRVSDNVLVADSGDIYDAAGVSSTASQFGVWTMQQNANFQQTEYKCCDGFINASGDCLPWTPCPIGRTESVRPTGTSDRVCV